jgi:hypothetical protein
MQQPEGQMTSQDLRDWAAKLIVRAEAALAVSCPSEVCIQARACREAAAKLRRAADLLDIADHPLVELIGENLEVPPGFPKGV